MLPIFLFVVMLWGVHVAAPDTRAGRAIFRLLVETPARRLSRITRGQVLLAVLLALAIGAAIWWQGDAISMMGMAAPDVAAMLGTFEVATWLDVAIAVAVTATTLHAAAVLDRFRSRLIRPRSRSHRTRPIDRQIASNDADEDRRCWAA